MLYGWEPARRAASRLRSLWSLLSPVSILGVGVVALASCSHHSGSYAGTVEEGTPEALVALMGETDAPAPFRFRTPLGGTHLNPVRFEVESDVPVARVEYLAEDRWPVGDSDDAGSGFADSYTFNSYGDRIVSAVAYNDSGDEIYRAATSFRVIENAEIRFLAPTGSSENPVTFRVGVDGPIARVAYLADGQFALDESSDAKSDFGIAYTFLSYGNRSIDAIGYDADGKEIARTTTTVTVRAPGDTGNGVATACYPGIDSPACVGTVVPSPVPSGYTYPARGGQYAKPEAYLDLQNISPSLALSRNFVLNEFAATFRGRYGVVQEHLIAHTQDIRDRIGAMNINSAYRPPGYNASIGGATYSRHMYGDAFDSTPFNASLQQLANACYAENASFVQLYVSHVHCDWRNERLSGAFYRPFAGATTLRRANKSGKGDFESLESLEIDGHDSHEHPETGEFVNAHIEKEGRVFFAKTEGFTEGDALRFWIARDGNGNVVETHKGLAYIPPERATRVDVIVGGVLLRSSDL